MHFGYNRKLPIVIRRVNNRTGIYLANRGNATVVRYRWQILCQHRKIHSENTKRISLRREITQIKHRTLCVPEMLELHIVSKNTTFWDVLVLTAEHHTTVSRNLPNILLHAHVLSRLSR